MPGTILVSDLPTLRLTNFTAPAVAYVTDVIRGGLFFYNPDNTLADNDGTIISSQLSGYWIRDLIRTRTVDPKWFGAAGDGTTDDTANFNKAIQFAAANNYVFITDGSTYKLNGTITPNGRLTWIAKDTTLMFYYPATGMNHYTQVNEVSGTRYVAFDTINCGDSCITGRLILTTAVAPTGTGIKMNTITRSNIAPYSNLIAWTASNDATSGVNGQISWEHLLITGFGYGLYQGEQPTGVGVSKVYPYPRCNIGLIEIKFCLVPFQVGKLTADKNYIGSGFDDTSINVLRCSRCANITGFTNSAFIAGTDAHVNSVFFDGLAHDSDYEVTTSGTAITLTYDNSVGVNKVTLSVIVPITQIQVGDIIAFPNGDKNNSVTPIYFVSAIKAIDNTGSVSVYTLDTPVGGNSITSMAPVNFFINPPGLKLVNAKFTSQHYFLEEVYDRGVELFDNAAFVSSDLKVSGGTFGCRTGYPIISTGLNCSAEINVHPTTFNNVSIKGLVGMGKVNSGTTLASISCKITSANVFADWLKCYLFSCIQLPGYLTSLFSSQYYTDNYNSNTMNSINAYLDCADGRYIYSGANGSNIFRQENSGNINPANTKTKTITFSSANVFTPIFNGGSTGDFVSNSVTLVYVKNTPSTANVLSYGIAMVVSNGSYNLFLTKIVGATGYDFRINSNNVEYLCPAGVAQLIHQVNLLRIS